MIIEGGTGNGYKAKVTDENFLAVVAVIVPNISHVSEEESLAFTLPFTQATDAGADAGILYIKNTSTLNLIFSQLWLSTTAADTIYTKTGVIGTPSGGTTPVPVNMNTGSAKVADGTFHQHTDIVGISGGSTTWRSYFTANAISQRLYFEDGFVLAPNGTWALYTTTAQAATVQGTLVFFYHI